MEPEPETLRLHATETDHIQKKSYPIAPAHYLKHTEVINAENIGTISLPQIKQLAKELSKNNVFPEIKDLSQDQVQELIDRTLSSEDIKFLDVLCLFSMSPFMEDMDTLIKTFFLKGS